MDDRRGAHPELEAAYVAHWDWLVRRLALVRDVEEARDLAQEAFVRANEHWPLADPTEPVRWLTTVGLRLAIAERRRRRRWGFFERRAQPRRACGQGCRRSIRAEAVVTDGQVHRGRTIEIHASLAHTGPLDSTDDCSVPGPNLRPSITIFVEP